MNKLDSNLMLHGIHLRENKHTEKNLVLSHHHQVYQILYVLENKGEIKFGDENQEFTQDNLAFITPYSDHSILAKSKLTVLILEFDLDKLDSEFQKIIDEFNFNETKLIQLNLIEAGEIKQLLRKMLYEQSQSQPINWLAMKIFLSELLLILLRSKKESKIKDANVLRAERLRKYIDTHYYEVINPSNIATRIGLSARHMNSIFKEEYEITPMQYLSMVRVEVAKKLLIETNNDIASICFEIGFESLSTFYRLFKSFTNFSPNNFRIAFQISNSEVDVIHN
ncbi:AraC family transcriptional regulator [Sporosarcina cascadiensis]|uniref:AraC family transcriptional regulator n=1 Tax=Sporosarcina cascadiensis TaxID=2660747 RepID=UPI001E3F7E21|nr:AraC family transcriptional regulator [Sporosarcina cascadiensis]